MMATYGDKLGSREIPGNSKGKGERRQTLYLSFLFSVRGFEKEPGLLVDDRVPVGPVGREASYLGLGSRLACQQVF